MRLNRAWVLILLPLTALFFVGGPSPAALPFVRSFWNFGHVIAFFIATLAIHPWLNLNGRKRSWFWLLAILLLSLLLESAQRWVGRDFSLLDIARNLCGAALALWLLNKKQTPKFVLAIASALLAYELSALSFVGWQDFTTQSRAPIIADFENRWLMQRWQGNIHQSELYSKSGQHSAKLTFTTGKYPTITFWPILRDWRGYQQLQIEVYNPSSQSEPLIIRLDDIAHALRADKSHSDRFNKALPLKSGWNSIVIPLAEIEQAPQNRVLDLSQMHQLLLFMVDVEQPKTLYLDSIQLR